VVLVTKKPPEKAKARQHYQRALELGAEPDGSLEAWMKEPKDDPAKPSSPKIAQTFDLRLPKKMRRLTRQAQRQVSSKNDAAAERIYRKMLAKVPDHPDDAVTTGSVKSLVCPSISLCFLEKNRCKFTQST